MPAGEQCGDQHAADQQQTIQPGMSGEGLDPTQAALGEEGDHPAADQTQHDRSQPQCGQRSPALQVVVAQRQTDQGE